MDPKIVKEVLDFKLHNQYPEGLTSKEKYVIKRRAETFRIKEGDLYYMCRRKRNQAQHLAKVVLTAEEANSIFEEFHCSQLGGHCGSEKTHSAIISRYYWPGMEEDIRKWVVQCPPCQSKRAPIKEKTQYNPIVVSEPLELVGMDLVGKLTLTVGGNQLLTDQGSELCNKVNYGLCQKLGIKRSLCSTYHPQTNGLVEKLNGTIQRSLYKVVAVPKDWDQYLQATMFALQTKKQLTTKYSPYFLMFGREARYPSAVDEEYEVTDDKVNRLLCLEEISEGAHKRQSVYEDVKHNVKKSQDRVRNRKQEKGQEDNFTVGPYKVYSENMMDLAPGKELETEVVNAYLCIVGRRTGACIDAYTMTQVWQGSQKCFRRLNLLKHDVAAGAVCRQGHWTLIIMYLKEKRSLFVDPFGATQKQIEQCRDVTRALVWKHYPAIGKWTCSTVGHPKQQDTTSCGVFVCKYPVDQEGVATLRLGMEMSLLNDTDDLSQLCRACGEESSGADTDYWIECTTCNKWYHSVCVGHPSTEGDYF
ncbi:hypothetical protein DPEC_G00059910 [Dallia pectoralis]|uniref:Uncharacterized protein n=1 Tax=Dallia pectoralis TaxID=75939 RepID=A0ACC2H6N1_DALPE|nr:hypothetical protein DPEC_G00059910 [Dallia pectoralis]